jgi:hypothetical protein
VLIDGDKAGAYQDHVSPYLKEHVKKLDLIYISHIDNDHIEGVLQLLDDLVEWRIFNFKTKKGQSPTAPKSLEPPEVDAIWHNAFHDLFGLESGQVAELLTARMTIFGNSDPQNESGPVGTALAATTQRFIGIEENLATGLLQAIRVSYRVSPRQLDIKLNPEFKGELVQVKQDMGKKSATSTIGGMSFFFLGPFEEDIIKLRDEWKKWLTKEAPKVADLARDAKKDIEALNGDEKDLITESALRQSSALRDRLASEISLKVITDVEDLGDRSKVTTPNLASIMVLVVEGGKTILLTGDGHADDILKGLAFHEKLLDADGNSVATGKLHVNVLKVQHHGAEFNINKDFCERITADHYIFCSNGLHDNPHLVVLQAIVEARGRSADGRDFTFWFNTSEPLDEEELKEAGYIKHMRKVAQQVKELAAKNKHLKVRFMDESSFELPF